MADIYSTPTDLTATSYTYAQIDLAWTNTETEAPIEIQRKQSGGVYHTLTTLEAGESSTYDTDVSSNTQYYYRIRYNLEANTSAWSTAVSEYVLPAPPTLSTVTFSGKTATLTWSVGDTYTYMRVYYKLAASGSWLTDTTTLSGTATTRDITVSTENALYDFRISGYNSTSSSESEYSTLTDQRSGIMAPTNLLLTSASTTSITATWTDNSSVEDGYEVRYMSVYESPTPVLFTTTAADATSSTVTGLTSGTLYTIYVKAKYGAYYSTTAYDTVTTGTVPDAAAVIGAVTVVSSTALTPTWTCTATNETGFTVYRSTDDSTYTEIGTAAANATSYADTGLSDYTRYYYKVRAYNTYGVSALSSSANAYTSADLDAPTSIMAEALSSTQIKLTFTVNADSASSHSVERKISGGSYASVGSTADGTTATYTDGTCSADTEYTYRVRAYHSSTAAYGDYSAPVSKKTLAVGTDTVRRNEAFFAMGDSLCVISETPQNSIAAYWRSKPLDCLEVDPRDANKYKAFYKVQLEYEDEYADVPVSVSLSTDGGTTWTTTSATVGTGSLLDSIEDFHFYGVTGRNVTLKIASTDTDTTFSWTALTLEYEPIGEYVTV